jgi:TPR repeat protein
MRLAWIYQRQTDPEKKAKAEALYQTVVDFYFQKAMDGDAESQIKLGWIYQAGEAVEQNLVEAMKWFKMAAEQGHPRGLFELGEMYLGGYGVTQDYSEAYKWFTLAAEQSSQAVKALFLKDKLSELTERHKEEGKVRAANYRWWQDYFQQIASEELRFKNLETTNHSIPMFEKPLCPAY